MSCIAISRPATPVLFLPSQTKVTRELEMSHVLTMSFVNLGQSSSLRSISPLRMSLLPQTGAADGPTSEALCLAYMKMSGIRKIEEFDLLQIDSKYFMGCGEFNSLHDTEEAEKANRRVTVALLKSSRDFPVTFPCKQGSIVPCQAQCNKEKGIRKTESFGCHFYDSIVRETNQGDKQASETELIDFEFSDVMPWKKIELYHKGSDATKILAKYGVQSKKGTQGVKVNVYPDKEQTLWLCAEGIELEVLCSKSADETWSENKSKGGG